jgi:hypothetical protein
MLNHSLAGQWQGLPIDWNVMVENFGPIEDSNLDNIPQKTRTSALQSKKFTLTANSSPGTSHTNIPSKRPPPKGGAHSRKHLMLAMTFPGSSLKSWQDV